MYDLLTDIKGSISRFSIKILSLGGFRTLGPGASLNLVGPRPQPDLILPWGNPTHWNGRLFQIFDTLRTGLHKRIGSETRKWASFPLCPLSFISLAPSWLPDLNHLGRYTMSEPSDPPFVYRAPLHSRGLLLQKFAIPSSR